MDRTRRKTGSPQSSTTYEVLETIFCYGKFSDELKKLLPSKLATVEKSRIMPLPKNNLVFEIHYWFNDQSHSMDAVLQHKCESEVLGIIKAIAESFGEEVIIETEPVGEGGFTRLFRISDRAQSTARKAATITSLVTTLFISPLGNAIIKATDKWIERAFEDPADKEIERQGKQLDNEKKKAEIEQIKAETEIKKQQLQTNSVVVKRRSNFYSHLSKYPKVTQISFAVQAKEKRHVDDSFFVEKEEFQRFILESNELNPLEIQGAMIEIVSPVLKRGRYKWKGIYDGKVISFYMKSESFNAEVQSGSVNFKNGTSIKCLLEVKQRLDVNGEVENYEYNILEVDEYYDSGKPIVVKRAKKPRNGGDQPNLFDLFGE